MKTLKSLLLAIAILASCTLTAQVAISTDGSNADGSAMLDVKSTSKGFLPPRMTTAQIGAIGSPADGLTVYNTDDGKLYIYVLADNKWKGVAFVTGTIPGPYICEESFVDARDSKSYSTVLIGTQCWMAENLNYDQSAYGEDWCYDNNSANCDTYGRLYDWAAVMQGAATSNSNPSGVQGVCPEGWHLPSDPEWTTLTDYVSSQPGYLCNSNLDYIAKALASTTNWYSSSNTCAVGNNQSANNATGFSALPGGARIIDGSFYYIGGYGYWWSATENSADNAWDRSMNFNNSDVGRDNNLKEVGFSVRCVRD